MEGEEEHPPRRFLAGRTQQPQLAPRRLLGAGQSVPSRAVRIPGGSAVPRGTASRPSRENSRALAYSGLHQDLLAPVVPAHESDEEALEALAEAEIEEGASARAVGAERPAAGLVRRRLGDEYVPRVQSQRSAAALRDVRDDFNEADELQEDAVEQGDAY